MSQAVKNVMASPIWLECPATRIVWLSFLGMSERSGRWNISPTMLSHHANLTLAEVETALTRLAGSAIPGGPYIAPTEKGWRITASERREEALRRRNERSAEGMRRLRAERAAAAAQRIDEPMPIVPTPNRERVLIRKTILGGAIG